MAKEVSERCCRHATGGRSDRDQLTPAASGHWLAQLSSAPARVALWWGPSGVGRSGLGSCSCCAQMDVGLQDSQEGCARSSSPVPVPVHWLLTHMGPSRKGGGSEPECCGGGSVHGKNKDTQQTEMTGLSPSQRRYLWRVHSQQQSMKTQLWPFRSGPLLMTRCHQTCNKDRCVSHSLLYIYLVKFIFLTLI